MPVKFENILKNKGYAVFLVSVVYNKILIYIEILGVFKPSCILFLPYYIYKLKQITKLYKIYNQSLSTVIHTVHSMNNNMTTGNGDLNQQRTVSSNTGVGQIKNQNQQNQQPMSPNNANRTQAGSSAASPVNMIPNTNKENKSQQQAAAAYDGNNNNTQTTNQGSGSTTTAANRSGSNGATAQPKDRNRDLSTAKTAQSTPQNANSQANRTIGHYVVGRSLGQGTFGKVRLGTHLITGEKVAIKILEKDKIKDQSDVERVTREIHILKIVRHPNVIQLYEIIETSRQLFLIMEYASGGELFDYIVKQKRLSEEEACRFTQQIISGVEYIHKVRICHRDLKPENLLLDDQNNIKIVDFGLSNMYQEGEMLKTACGSPCYAAPEMIAGKRYHGLNSDIWSTGIILYAMTCGYLPFEDPNTSKLYKKILNCDYLIPGFISKASKDLIRKILNTDPNKRYTVKEIRGHEWYQQVKPAEMEGIVIGKDRIPVLDEYLSKIQDCFATSGISPNCDLSQTVTYIQNNKHNQITSTYYLLLKKKQRETGRDVFFEQVMRDKKRNLYSTSNLNNMPFNSLQKIQTPGKIMMHSTMGSGFKVNQVSKSEARPLQTQTQEGFNSKLNPATKKYLEQMNKIQKKRTESTAQARLADMMSNFKQNGMDKHSMTNSPLAAETHAQVQQNFRGAQSQSPTQRINGMLGSQKPNQTFFMADRMRKQGGGSNVVGGNRALPIDEMNSTHAGIMLQSTNDSRIHDMLPNVNSQGNKNQIFNQTRVGGFGSSSNHSGSNKMTGNQQVQMRQTMFNGNFMTKLRQSNAGHATPINNFGSPQANQYDMSMMTQHDRDTGGSSAFGTAASSVGHNRIGTTSGVGHQNAANQAHLLNLVNQRKTPNTNTSQQQQMMMTTQFFNQGGNNVMFPGPGTSANHSNSNSISKTIAKAKLRQQRASRGASNPVHQSDGGNFGAGAAEYQNALSQVAANQFNQTGFHHGSGHHTRKQSIHSNMGGGGSGMHNGPLNIGNFTSVSSGGGNVLHSNSGNHTAISGGRKQTADNHAYTLYKPNKPNARGKFSNGGGSISGDANGSFDNTGYGNGSMMGVDKSFNINNFSTNPNTTASRFYNPKNAAGSPHQNNLMNDTQTRFMQNLQNNRPKMLNQGMVGANNNGVFQNNFLLPKASPNTGGMIKTFYNSKQSTSGVGSTTGSSSGGMGGIPANIYHHSNNSSNSTKRAIQGMKMHI